MISKIIHKSTLLVGAMVWACVSLHAQTIFQGRIVDDGDKPIPSLSITLSTLDSTIINYANSDAEGKYRISYSGNAPRLILSVSGINYPKVSKEISNTSQTVNFQMRREPIKLREVVVKADKIRASGDTLNYLVSSFKHKNDVTIGDVIKNMPGINIEGDGTIQYNGKPISDFYIENMDALNGRYNIATNNISANDVGVVQILQNHQPVKALKQHQYSDRAAINIKLTEKSKNVLLLTGVAGLGADKSGLLRHEELNGMLFSKSHQHISLYKTDDVGNDVSADLTNHTGGSILAGFVSTGNVSMPAPPNIDKRYYLFNDDHVVSVNNLQKLKDEATLQCNISFAHQNDRRHELAQTVNVIDQEGERVITEEMNGSTMNNCLDAELKYERNLKTSFLSNSLNFTGNWERDGAMPVTNGISISQNGSKDHFAITNNTNWIHNYKDDRGIGVTSSNSLSILPQDLYVSPGLYADLLNQGLAYSQTHQHSRQWAFSSNNVFSLLSALTYGKIRITPRAGFSVDYREMESHIGLLEEGSQLETAPDGQDKKYSNSLNWLQLVPLVNLWSEYKSKDFFVGLGLGGKWESTNTKDRLNDASIRKNKFYFNPSLTMRYTPSTVFSLKTEHYVNHTPSGFDTMYTGYLLSDYRNLSRCDLQYYDGWNYSGNIGMYYASAKDMLFANGSVGMTFTKSDGQFGQMMDGILTTTLFYRQPNISRTYFGHVEVSKSFDWKQLGTALKFDYGLSSGKQMRQQTLIGYRNRWLGLSYSVGLTPFSWLQISLDGSAQRNFGEIDGEERQKAIWNADNHANLLFSISEPLTIVFECENYYNDAVSHPRSFTLATWDVSTHIGMSVTR